LLTSNHKRKIFGRCACICFLIAMLCGLCIRGSAQRNAYIFRHISTESGLASNQVRSVCQDSEGYIWIATWKGLQRYDGYRFLTYKADLHNPDALQSDEISTIFEDSRHRLWIGTDKGAPYLFNRVTGKFYNFNAHVDNKSNAIAGVWKFLEDSKGSIWITGKTGIFKLNSISHEFESQSAQLGLSEKLVSAQFANDQHGNIWFITTDGLKYYNLDEGRIYDRNNNPAGLGVFDLKQTISDILFDNDWDVWITTTDPNILYRFNFRTNRMKAYSLQQPAGKPMTVATRRKEFIDVVGKDGRGLAIITMGWKGLAVYDAHTDTFSLIPVNDENPYGLHGSLEKYGAMHSFTDREGNTWIGTDKGLNVFSYQKQPFYFYSSENNYTGSSAFSTLDVEGLLQTGSDGDLWVAYYDGNGGIVRLDSNFRFKRKYLITPGESPKNQLWCLFQDEKGIIWAPNQDQTMLRLDPGKNRLTLAGDSALSGFINTMQQDRNGDTWVGHWSKGLIKMEHGTHRTHCFSNPPAALSSPVKNVSCLYFDVDGILWAGTYQQGLLRFDKGKNEFTDAYLFDEKNGASISSNVVTNMIPYNQDTLLLATSFGINIFDKKKRSFSIISSKDGLPDNFVQTIFLDKQQNVWAGCVTGFCKVDIHSREVTNYDLNDGIIDSGFSPRPFCCLRNGNCLVAGNRGFMVFNPDSVKEKKTPPNVSITGFRVNDQEVNIDPFLNQRQPLALPYQDNDLKIQFASLQFAAPGKIRYYYQLEGVDKDWIQAGKEQEAHYSQLRSGHYLFKIRCVNRSGIQSRDHTLLSIHIVPAFWNTWWFYLGIALLAAGGFFLAVKWINERRKEKELLHLNYEKKIAVMEMNTLRAQMNPHFIFNSLNSINTFILKNDQENATDYLSKFSQLVRLILDNSRTEWVSLENELKALKLYIELEALRFDNAFTYSIRIGQDVLSSQALVPPLIIQPYVENAIWHGLLHRKSPGGKIAIDIWKENNKLMMQVTDNGVGRAEAAKLESKNNTQHKSHGMKITAERLAVVNEVYKVNARVAVTDLPDTVKGISGTQILLTIQYKTHAGINH
jgi:ligand-binding sensor domain-containing protein